MCNWCEHDRIQNKAMITKKFLDGTYIGWNKNDLASDLDYERWYISVEKRCDTGYLRLTTTDNNCIESGSKIEINFCPMCGEQLGVFKEDIFE